MNTDTPTFSPSQFLALLTMIVTELVNDAVIDGHTAQIITGIAGIVVPAIWMLADAWIHHSHAQVKVAQLKASSGTPHA